MIPIHFDPATTSDDDRRHALYRGALIVTSATTATAQFCAFARKLLTEAFDGLDPEQAQHAMPVEAFAAVLADLKPRFIHHPASRTFVQTILEERGCDLDETYFDVPRLRSSTSDGYLTTGIAYAYEPHRDTWCSAPMAQLNFWMPVYELDAENGMAFHLEHFDTPVPNSSGIYNYYLWNQKHRAAAASNIGSDPRPMPLPADPIDATNAVTLLPPVGGLIEFSGQHLHSSVPNTTGRTRYSIDFRTVHVVDVRAGRAAPNVDAACTGTSIRDFVRASDLTAMPDDVVAQLSDGSEDGGELVYTANLADRSGSVADE